jgi:hypothetical protein
METVVAIFDFIFGCHHRHLSRVFTMGGQTYRVCCDCGKNFKYCLATMAMEPPLRTPVKRAVARAELQYLEGVTQFPAFRGNKKALHFVMRHR